ncbi:GDP-mannose 4,6-dehydratase [Leifsonia sp. LS1]|uniref:GDP-mannose 4,6-dehydratase n=1 Tax=Leifsonia sp. LS1 TaxID=2828483 RepID=UPI001CFCE225|nr:GDP-mannose 4,6-dehydratase [Leifsonia sp. LS1]GIT80998.1 GDP-mannose 4,6-dehydratase [Leifsonia sp. LS1]
MAAAQRILLTGATGQDGSYLVDQLSGEGHEIHALIRPGDLLPADDRVIWRTGDLADTQSLVDIVDEVEPDIVFNLAGISSVAFSWQQPLATVEVSGAAVAALIEASWRLQERKGRTVRFVQASSSEIFGSAIESPQTETTPVRPASPYGAAKALGHSLMGIYRSRGMHASSAILYNHESPRRPETFVTRKITAQVARIAAGLEETLQLGNLDSRRDWGWAPDYVDAMVRMADAESGGDYVIATGRTHSVRDFAGAAFLRAGVLDWQDRLEVDDRFKRPADVAEMRGDPSRAREELGWSPTLAFEEIVGAMVEHDLALVRAAS